MIVNILARFLEQILNKNNEVFFSSFKTYFTWHIIAVIIFFKYLPDIKIHCPRCSSVSDLYALSATANLQKIKLIYLELNAKYELKILVLQNISDKILVNFFFVISM